MLIEFAAQNGPPSVLCLEPQLYSAVPGKSLTMSCCNPLPSTTGPLPKTTAECKEQAMVTLDLVYTLSPTFKGTSVHCVVTNFKKLIESPFVMTPSMMSAAFGENHKQMMAKWGSKKK